MRRIPTHRAPSTAPKPLTRILPGWIALALLAFALALGALPGRSVAAGETNCGRTVPAATDGQLTLDRSSVRPGDITLGVLSHFRTWPQYLIGGGSGETFLSCTPWPPRNERAEVMAYDGTALYLIRVPSGTPAGHYQVSVLFYQGSTKPFSGGKEVRLTTSLTVTANPGAPAAVSPACQARHASAVAGALAAPAVAQPGTDVRVSLAVPAIDIGTLNEYDRLIFLVCLNGRATPITSTSTSGFTVPIPPDTPSGSYRLIVTGHLGGTGVVSWSRRLVVGPQLSSTGRTLWPAALAAGLLLLVGGCLVFVARRRPAHSTGR